MLLTLFDSLLCSSRTYSELTKNLISALKVSGLKEKNCAAKLYEYCYIDESKGFLAEAEKLKSLIAQKLEGISPASFTVSGRKKAFRSHVKKLWSRYPDLDRVKDEYAFRIIISDKPKDNMNYKRINISGFACDESGNIVEDIHGIINPLPIGKISKYEVSNDPITWDV